MAVFVMLLTGCTEEQAAELEAELQAAARQSVEDQVSSAADDVRGAIRNALGRSDASEDSLPPLVNNSIDEFALCRYRNAVLNLGGDVPTAVYNVLALTGISWEFPSVFSEIINPIASSANTRGSQASVGRVLGQIAMYIESVKYILDVTFLEISLDEMQHHMMMKRVYYINIGASPLLIENIDGILNDIENTRELLFWSQTVAAAELAAYTAVGKYGGPYGWIALVLIELEIPVTLELRFYLWVMGLVDIFIVNAPFTAYENINRQIRNREYLVY